MGEESLAALSLISLSGDTRYEDDFPSPAWSPLKPRDRSGFYVAIICALALEARAVRAAFDKRWEDSGYGCAPGDLNAYSTGVIGRHNVVLAHMPSMGKVAAATAATSLRSSFPNIQLAIVVGVCGGAPVCKETKQEIMLGDVVISQGLVQSDLGRRYSDDFVRKDTPQDSLPRPPPKLGAVLAKLQASTELSAELSVHLGRLQTVMGSTVEYPGTTEDRLFKPTYRHRHNQRVQCLVCQHPEKKDICDTAVNSSCEELGCDRLELVVRSRPTEKTSPVIHFGLVASADTVMKSAHFRDKAIGDNGVIAFEMEGAGVWEKFPGCLVIKGVCDYADGHKNKIFQGFASATAAAATRLFLENWSIESFHAIATSPADTMPRSNSGWCARRMAVLDQLSVSSYRDGKNRNDDRIAGTCEWFTQHPMFQQWKETPTSSMLWVSADPGCGKSVLAKYLIDTVLPTDSSRTTCYFFFKDDVEDQKSARDAVSCLLRQLFLQRRELFTEDVLDRFEVDGKSIYSSFRDIWDILVSACETGNAGEIIMILDAMDEAELSSKMLLSKALCSFYGAKRNSKLKFLITSRPYGDIRRGFQPLDLPGLPVIRLSGESDEEMEKISREIDLFIKARADHIQATLMLGQDERDLLLKGLMSVPNRTYLWVHLTLDLIETTVDIDREGLATVIAHIPKTVNDAYERILSRSSDPTKAAKLLHIVVAAQRPLTVSEMNVALAIRPGHVSYSDLSLWSENRFRESIRDLCGLFISIVDSKIYLLHQTAKEFLLHEASKIHHGVTCTRSKSQTWKGCLELRESHGILGDICISHLQFAEFAAETFPQDAESPQYVTDHVFLDYSAKSWANHLRNSDIDIAANLTPILKLCETSSTLWEGWFTIYGTETNTRRPSGFSAFMLACYFGLTSLAMILIKRGKVDLDAQDGTNGRSALSWAAGNGFKGTVQFLMSLRQKEHLGWSYTLSRKKNRPGKDEWLDSQDKRGRTPLIHAILGNHIEVVELLLKANASIQQRDRIGQTAVSYGVCSGNKEIVDLVLAAGAQVKLENISQQLFLEVVRGGEEEVVSFLLKAGTVEPDKTDQLGRSPLSHAASLGHVGIAKLLLETGKVTPDLSDRHGCTPLMEAAKSGCGVIGRLLLETKRVNPDKRDNRGCSPLLFASRQGSEAIVKYLLDTGSVDPDIRDDEDRTPLSWAAERGDYGIVELLLNKGKANPALKNSSGLGMTPLARAANHGHLRVVKLLLGTGRAEPESEDRIGITALMRALSNVHGADSEQQSQYQDIVKTLMAAQSKVPGNPSTFDDPRVLKYAITYELPKAVGLLLETASFDVNTTTLSGTPLGWAARSGHMGIVKILLDTKKCDVDLADKWGRTPLAWAARYGNVSTMELLFGTGELNIESRDTGGYTPLALAAQYNQAHAVRFLITVCGADVNSKDNLGRTPLLLATEKRHAPVIAVFQEVESVGPSAKEHEGSVAVDEVKRRGAYTLSDTPRSP